jgi:enoyl-CoA hydratase/carnithine racemase
MSEILIDRSRDSIAIVTINRPARRNALRSRGVDRPDERVHGLRARLPVFGWRCSRAPPDISAQATT